jgi:4-hydroxy-tetrahydrodipicolinate synthase
VTGRAELGGTWFVLPTPFAEDGSVDLDSQRRLVEAAMSWGVEGLTAMGVTSEASALTPEERSEALAAVAEAAAGRVALVVGCSGGSVGVVVERMREAVEAGAVAAMVSAPPGLRDPAGLPDFFARVGGEGGLPLVVQDEPAATGVVVPADLLLRCLEASCARTVKLEDAPTPPKIGRLLEVDPGLRVFGGLGGVSALEELKRGACGTMTGFAFPEILRAVREALERGDPTRAAAVFDRFLPLIRFEAQPGMGLAIRKELLRRRGTLRTAVTRRGGTLTEEILDGLEEVLGRVGIEPGRERLAIDRGPRSQR